MFIFDLAGNLLQAVKFHTSCSQPLNVGDQFGALQLLDLETEDARKIEPTTETRQTTEKGGANMACAATSGVSTGGLVGDIAVLGLVLLALLISAHSLAGRSRH